MAKRGRKRKKLIKSAGFRLKAETVNSIFFIFFLLLSIISIFSFLQIGPIPTQYNLLLSQYFGFTSVFIPFLLILISFVFTKIKIPLKEPNVPLGFSLMFLSTVSLLQQGIVGQFIWAQFLTLFTSPALIFIIFFFLFIVGFVILFDTSVVQIVRTILKVIAVIRKYTLGSRSRKSSSKLTSPEPLFAKNTPLSVPAKDKSTDMTVGIPPVLKPSPIAPTLPLRAPPVNSSSHQVWEYPPITIFDDPTGTKADRGDVRQNAQTIEQTLDSFGITAKVREINDSPSVTQYALEVALGTKLAKIVSLSNDLAMALAAPGGQIRVEAPIPGRPYVGIEVPNRSLEVVPIRKIIESEPMKHAKSKLAVPLGLDVSGNPRVADIAKMPHVLIAGQTGSGKSVCVNSWICSLLFRASPDEVKLIMVDPKRVELTPYNGIPHLLTPVIVEPEKVVSALKWAVAEMERRYKMFTEIGAKNIEAYNEMSGFQSVPYIVIFVDELAEIIMYSPSEVEDNICRLAQMARAVGIHLVLATQRPSVNVITGLIKANIPTRVAFAVASMTDSRVILDTPGAEKLLGRGDMLYTPPDLAKPVRIQMCLITDTETNRLIDYLKAHGSSEPQYNDQVISQPVASPNSKSANIQSVDGEERDAVFEEAVKLIQASGKASASLFQRHLKLGYARAARLLDQLESAGIVGPGQGAKPRQILVPHNQSSDDTE